ncbi:membrane protein insertion efficiency factor YidD [Algiphilus sp.]|uniref:membrane protein insertion efficiency factor YidD n=1 Tax=Algiphilus sp. TaxID=1872431 RepID=UPI001CA7308D|nr:membrane protein insertion efficiency factor YidD [Algiphilus acroporae]
MLRGGVLRAIAAYRASGGGRRWFGIACNFEPTCSAFAEEAIRRHGLLHGLAMTWRRLRRCRVRDAVCVCIEPVPADPRDA